MTGRRADNIRDARTAQEGGLLDLLERPRERLTDPRHHKEMAMKTMTCRQLGGPCDVELSGQTADDVIKAQDRHLREAVRGGDATHEPAHEEMKGRWRHPVRSMGWYRQTKKTFANLPGL